MTVGAYFKALSADGDKTALDVGGSLFLGAG